MDKIEAAVNAVWQSFSDNVLRNMTPPEFLFALDDEFGLTDEESTDAWYEFEERQHRVFYHKEA